MAGLVPDGWGLGYLTDYTRPRSNTLLGLSAGLLSGNLANAPLYAMEGKKADDAYATAEKEKAAAAAQLNQTIEFLRQTAPKYAEAVQAGVLSPGDAYTMYVNDQKPQPGPQPIEINGQLVDPTTGQVIGDYRNQQGAAPIELSAGATLYDPTTNKPIYTAPAAPRAGGGMPSATLQKEIFETDEGVQAGENVIKSLDTALELNKRAWDGPFADVRSAGGALFGNQEAVDTQTLQNIVTSNALESLKATFGAAPTEGERKILLEIQGSVNQPKAVREAIFKRARAAAERRLEFNRQKANGLRTGAYFEEGYGQPTSNQTSTGVTWSIAP